MIVLALLGQLAVQQLEQALFGIAPAQALQQLFAETGALLRRREGLIQGCLLYTSDAADE